MFDISKRHEYIKLYKDIVLILWMIKNSYRVINI